MKAEELIDIPKPKAFPFFAWLEHVGLCLEFEHVEIGKKPNTLARLTSPGSTVEIKNGAMLSSPVGYSQQYNGTPGFSHAIKAIWALLDAIEGKTIVLDACAYTRKEIAVPKRFTRVLVKYARNSKYSQAGK